MIRNSRLSCALLLAAALCQAGASPRRLPVPGVDARQYLADVRYLASEELKGRGTGMPELDKAAAYVAREFRKAGLLPVNGLSYLQPFKVTIGSRLGAGNRMAASTGDHTAELTLTAEFSPLNFSGSGHVKAPLVFAGYGITAAEYGYDDYAGIDVKGKAVIVLRHEPQEHDAGSPFEGRIYTEHAQFGSKADNAIRHGAAALILVGDTANHSGSDALDPFTAYAAPGPASIPVVQVKAEVVESWCKAAGREWKEIQEAIDRDLRPQSFELPPWAQVELEISVVNGSRTVNNVVGYLPGSKSEYVIVGAHYDHLGLGEQFSLGGGQAGKPHPGADDNASGTAGVLALARWFAGRPKPERGILFMAYAGEELGMLGSGHYVRNPLLPPELAIAMINLDMIGRVRENRVIVGGAATGSSFERLLGEAQRRSSLTLETEEKVVYGSSDHTAFLRWKLPVLFFFSGLHNDYHRPSDTWDKIDAPNTARLLDLVADVVGVLANGPERPRFVPRQNPPPSVPAETP